jgi:hypothetical protein
LQWIEMIGATWFARAVLERDETIVVARETAVTCPSARPSDLARDSEHDVLLLTPVGPTAPPSPRRGLIQNDSRHVPFARPGGWRDVHDDAIRLEEKEGAPIAGPSRSNEIRVLSSSDPRPRVTIPPPSSRARAFVDAMSRRTRAVSTSVASSPERNVAWRSSTMTTRACPCPATARSERSWPDWTDRRRRHEPSAPSAISAESTARGPSRRSKDEGRHLPFGAAKTIGEAGGRGTGIRERRVDGSANRREA